MGDFETCNYIAASARAQLWPSLQCLYTPSGETQQLNWVEGTFENPSGSY